MSTVVEFRTCCFGGLGGLLYLVGYECDHPDDPAAFPPPCLRGGGPPCSVARAFAGNFLSPPRPLDPEPFDMDALLKSLDDDPDRHDDQANS